MSEEIYNCKLCKYEVLAEDDYCPNCGTIFNENVLCSKHENFEANGICLICLKPFCTQCGDMVDNIYLCRDHERYEVVQNYARIRGGHIESELLFLKDCLEKDGLHPIIYSRRESALHLGGGGNLYQPASILESTETDELKLMVPCGEVLESEKLLLEIEENSEGFVDFPEE